MGFRVMCQIKSSVLSSDVESLYSDVGGWGGGVGWSFSVANLFVTDEDLHIIFTLSSYS